jgi:hypothetical protein
MRRNRPESKMPRRRSAEKPAALTRREMKSPAAALHHADEPWLSAMKPGDVILLDDAVTLREAIDPAFFAVLACPFCGTPGLITLPQYFGATPVMCGSKDCCGLYRIVDQCRFASLPVN